MRVDGRAFSSSYTSPEITTAEAPSDRARSRILPSDTHVDSLIALPRSGSEEETPMNLDPRWRSAQ